MKSFLQYLTESKLLSEGKQEFLKKYQAKPDVKDLVSKFWIIRQRLKAPQNDIDWWIKQPYDEFKKFVVNFDTSKNKETRKQDSYIKEAEKWGAVMFGKFGQYEAWFVPTYEAAVQLGRFYKSVSAKWCISTNNFDYFNNQYKDSEFIFLISDDKSLKNYQKIALQLTEHKDLEGVWDVDDNDIFDDIPEFLEQPINNALLEFRKLNRSRNDKITKSIIAKNEEHLKANANKIVQDKLNSVKLIDKDTIPDIHKQYVTSITIPNSVTEIGEHAFLNCIRLKSLIMPNSITKINDVAFGNCRVLKLINLSKNLNQIGLAAFIECFSIEQVTIPDSVTEIGNNTFINCFALKQVIFSSNSPMLEQIKDGKYKTWGLKQDQIFIRK